MLFLTEANEKYIDELERFKNEVLICDRDNKDQFAGCMGLRDCSNVKEWIDICNLRKSAETCEQAGTPHSWRTCHPGEISSPASARRIKRVTEQKALIISDINESISWDKR